MYNRWAGIGRLTRDPEVRYTQNSNTAITKCTLAINRDIKREGQPDADFVPFVAFGKTAENLAKYMKKGSQICVSGRLETSSWDDQDGKRHYSINVIAEEIHFLEYKKGNKSNENEGEDQFNYEGFNSVDEEDDLPF